MKTVTEARTVPATLGWTRRCCKCNKQQLIKGGKTKAMPNGRKQFTCAGCLPVVVAEVKQ